MTPAFFAYKQRCASGHKTCTHPSVLAKRIQDQAPQEVQNILSWAQNNLMTVNFTKTKEMVVKCKVERPLPTVTFDIKQEEFLKLSGVYFHSNPINWDKQIDALPSKAGRRVHILRVYKKYGYSLESLHHLLHCFIIPIFTYGISVWGVASYVQYLYRIDK